MSEPAATEDPEAAGTAQGLTVLRRLVTILTGTMIAGVLAVVGLLAIKLTQVPLPSLPAEVSVPEGARALALTVGEGWYLVVTDAGEALVFDSLTGQLRQRVRILAGDAAAAGGVAADAVPPRP